MPKGKGWRGDVPPMGSNDCYKCGKRTLLHDGQRICQNQSCEKFTTISQLEAQTLREKTTTSATRGYVRTVKLSDPPVATQRSLVDDD